MASGLTSQKVSLITAQGMLVVSTEAPLLHSAEGLPGMQDIALLANVQACLDHGPHTPQEMSLQPTRNSPYWPTQGTKIATTTMLDLTASPVTTHRPCSAPALNSLLGTHLVHNTVQVDGGALLAVHADNITACLGKVCHPLLGLHNHLQRGRQQRISGESAHQTPSGTIQRQRSCEKSAGAGSRGSVHQVAVPLRSTILLLRLIRLLLRPHTIVCSASRGTLPGPERVLLRDLDCPEQWPIWPAAPGML